MSARLVISVSWCVAGPAASVEAVEGRSVALPCNVTPPRHDKLYMVFWFRDDQGFPLYSFDVRGRPLSQASHWSSPDAFGPRAFFRTTPSPAELVLEDVRLRDEGAYRCRVDFRHAPTRSYTVHLTVVVLPERPLLLDRWGRPINSTLGPLQEGDHVYLTCRVVGGKPEPAVRWLLEGRVLDEESEQRSGHVVDNRLALRGVSRRLLGAALTCRASNTALADPRQTSVTLDLLLSPLWVRLTVPRDPLEAGRRYTLRCEAAGSRPPATISWFRAGRHVATSQERSGGNVSLSELTLRAGPEDDGGQVACRAHNPRLPAARLEDARTLSVLYAPMVTLRLGPTLSADDVKEGDDVYFECHVAANPRWTRLHWLHDGSPLEHRPPSGVIVSNQSLALQRVRRQSAGRYVCAAANTQGEAASQELHFRVKYAPYCEEEGESVVGATRQETLEVWCRVSCDPPALAFHWQFNSSGETVEVAAARFSSNGSASLLRYTVRSELDYGTLLCWARNAVGAQARPCVFQVVAAGRPFPVRNCSLWNQTSSSVEVVCQAGFDGGLAQHFVLVLHSARGARLNLTAATAPRFALAGLQPDQPFWLTVFAVNAKGRSPPVLIEEITLRDPERRTGAPSPVPLPLAVDLAPVVAALAVLAALLLVALLLLWVRRGPPPLLSAAKAPPAGEADPNPDLIPGSAAKAPGVSVAAGFTHFEEEEEDGFLPDNACRDKEYYDEATVSTQQTKSMRPNYCVQELAPHAY
ncbi:nephrin-like [Schistocerca nitens]|uniref:nephrin-like n=1 Tax=Schistocerca nitens TaxID=7011 RepID=UPI00211831F0|nr:nephrin-like [Schistocerca nitens]